MNTKAKLECLLLGHICSTKANELITLPTICKRCGQKCELVFGYQEQKVNGNRRTIISVGKWVACE